MQIILVLILFLGIAIMTALIFIGFYLHKNGNQTITINEMLASKESDLIDLYNSLEQMMEEIEGYTNQAKTEIMNEKEQIMKLRDEMFDKLNVDITPKTETFKTLPTPLPLSIENKKQRKRETDQEQLMKRAERTRDFKGTKVRTLYNKGIPIVDIAKEMSIGQGEVQLLLNIKNKKI